MSSQKTEAEETILDEVDIDQLLADLESPVEDPLSAIPITDDLEKDAKAEVNAMLKAFQDRKKDETARKRLATDSEYWFAVCFQSREQKNAFLKAVEWFEHGDKYLDGKFVARKLGVKLPEVIRKFAGEKEAETLTAVIPLIRTKGGDSK